MVERLTTILRCLNEHLQILYNLLLAAEVAKAQGAQGILKVLLATTGKPLFAYVKIFVHAFVTV
jgi:hypothetical protein